MIGSHKSVLTRFGVAGGAFAVAMGIGVAMQSGSSGHLTALYAEAETVVPQIGNMPEGLNRSVPNQPMLVQVDDAADLQDLLQGQVANVQSSAPAPLAGFAETLSGIQFTSSDPGVSMPQATQSAPRPFVMQQPTTAAATGVAQCDPSITATAADVAMIDLNVDAPCHANARVTLHHEGMMFAVQTDGRGQANIQVPALKVSSIVIASFEDGIGAMIETNTPSLASYDRVVLQWQGNTGLQIHAFEFGASYDQKGHVWSGQPQAAADTMSGEGGFVLQLGNPNVANPLLAEVYTFPSGTASRTGDVDMTVEAEVTRQNCERSVAAQTLQFSPNQGLTIQDLTFSLPSCQAIGEFLVLNNLLNSVQLAQR